MSLEHVAGAWNGVELQSGEASCDSEVICAPDGNVDCLNAFGLYCHDLACCCAGAGAGAGALNAAPEMDMFSCMHRSPLLTGRV